MKTFNTTFAIIHIQWYVLSLGARCDVNTRSCVQFRNGGTIFPGAPARLSSMIYIQLRFYASAEAEWKSLFKWNFTLNQIQQISSNVVHCWHRFLFHIYTDWFQYALIRMGAKWKLFGKHNRIIHIFWLIYFLFRHRCLLHWQKWYSRGSVKW